MAGKHGISIGANGVTLDLNGFALIGAGGTPSSSGDAGIVPGISGLTNVTVRNGSIRNWNGNGINFSVPTAFNMRVENVTVVDSGATGISGGYQAFIVGCQAQGCGGSGIASFGGATIASCNAYNNTIAGFEVGAAGGAVITGCIAFNNRGVGIRSFGGTVSACVASGNDEQGILANSTPTNIEACTCDDNKLDGISVGDSCRVSGCVTARNGSTTTQGAGIRATGVGAIIEGNLSRANSFGYYIQGTGNLVVRNTASSNNTNWIATASNVRGPIIDRTALVSPAIAGDSAPSVLGSTDPHANFTI